MWFINIKDIYNLYICVNCFGMIDGFKEKLKVDCRFALLRRGKSGQRRVPHHLMDGTSGNRWIESVTENYRQVLTW